MHYFQIHIEPQILNFALTAIALSLRLTLEGFPVKFQKHLASSLARNGSCWPEIWFGLFLKSWNNFKLTDLRFKVVATEQHQAGAQTRLSPFRVSTTVKWASPSVKLVFIGLYGAIRNKTCLLLISTPTHIPTIKLGFRVRLTRVFHSLRKRD